MVTLENAAPTLDLILNNFQHHLLPSTDPIGAYNLLIVQSLHTLKPVILGSRGNSQTRTKSIICVQQNPKMIPLM